jgi:hypothetical protein
MAAELSIDIADASAKVASWSKERVCVEVKSGNDTLPAVIKEVCSDNTAIVELVDKSLVIVRLADVCRTAPQKDDRVLIICGKYSGVEGEIVNVYGPIASVKDYDDICRFVDLIDLAMICKEDQQYDLFNGDEPIRVNWKFSLLDDKVTIGHSKSSSDSVSNQEGQHVKVPRLSLLALTAVINAFEEQSDSSCPVMKYHWSGHALQSLLLSRFRVSIGSMCTMMIQTIIGTMIMIMSIVVVMAMMMSMVIFTVMIIVLIIAMPKKLS